MKKQLKSLECGRIMNDRASHFYIDPEMKQPHIYNHGVSESEVEYVFKKPGEDRPGHEGSRVAIGQTDAGRHLRVIYVLDLCLRVSL